MAGGGACVAGGMHGRGCKWQGVCMVGRHGFHDVWQGACMAGGMHGMGGVHVWQERRPLQRTVLILLECILVYIRI